MSRRDNSQPKKKFSKRTKVMLGLAVIGTLYGAHYFKDNKQINSTVYKNAKDFNLIISQLEELNKFSGPLSKEINEQLGIFTNTSQKGVMDRALRIAAAMEKNGSTKSEIQNAVDIIFNTIEDSKSEIDPEQKLIIKYTNDEPRDINFKKLDEKLKNSEELQNYLKKKI